MAAHSAEIGDVYLLRVCSGGEEFHAGRAEACRLRQAVGVLEVTVEAIEADGTVVETTWTSDLPLLRLVGRQWMEPGPAPRPGLFRGSSAQGPRIHGRFRSGRALWRGSRTGCSPGKTRRSPSATVGGPSVPIARGTGGGHRRPTQPDWNAV